MRWLIYGGRKFRNRRFMFLWLDRLAMESDGWPLVVIHGGAAGADHYAELWAAEVGCEIERYPVSHLEWQQYGKSAGPRRNETMIVTGKPDIAIGFPGGAGTADMTKRVLDHGIRNFQPKPIMGRPPPRG